MGNADSAHEHASSTEGAHHQHHQHQQHHPLQFDSAPSTLQYTRKSQQSIDRENISHHHLHHHQQHHQQQPPTASSAIKVLPKLSDQQPPGLRTTNNGLILHNGGTISAKSAAAKSAVSASRFSGGASRPPSGPPQRAPPPAIARAFGGVASHQKQSTQQQPLQSPSLLSGLPPLMKRSRTQHDMLGTPSNPAGTTAAASGSSANGWAANSRRYFHQQQQQRQTKNSTTGGAQIATANKTADIAQQKTVSQPTKQQQQQQAGPTSLQQAKVNASPKKYSAPLPPPSQQQQQQPQHRPPTAFVAPVPRKLRMFKTKAESRKNSAAASGGAVPVVAAATAVSAMQSSAAVNAPAATAELRAATVARSREPTLLDVRRSHSPPPQQPAHQQPQPRQPWQTLRNATATNILPRIDPTTTSAHQHLRSTASAAQMQANYLRREKSFDLNLLRAHHEATASAAAAINNRTGPPDHHHRSSRHRLSADEATVATESTSGSLPARRSRSKEPLSRSRQLLQPQLLGQIDLDRRPHEHEHHRFHVPPPAALASSRPDENNNHNHNHNLHIATADAAHTAAILDEYLTKSIQLDAISRFTDALQQHGPQATPAAATTLAPTPAERYMSPPIVDQRILDDFDASSSSTSDSSSAAGDGRARGGAARAPASSTTASSLLSYHADALVATAAAVEQQADASDSSSARRRQHIHINVRPTLPRRQFDIPRFNPAEAWRSLNDAAVAAVAAAAAAERQRECLARQHASAVGEEVLVRPLPVRSRVRGRGGAVDEEVQVRLMHRQHQHYEHSSRSAESGISSGEDLQPPVQIGGGGGRAAAVASQLPSTWTPQQDLGDEDDDDDIVLDDDQLSECTPPPMLKLLGGEEADDPVHFYPEVTDNITRSRQRNHCSMFSLSLPRDSHMSSSTTDHDPQGGLSADMPHPVRAAAEFSSLKKQASRDSGTSSGAPAAVQSGDNWLLSSSAPNSLDETAAASASKPIRPMTTAEQRQRAAPLSTYTTPPLPSLASLHYFSTGPHVMCLPTAITDEAKQQHQQQRKHSCDEAGQPMADSAQPSAVAIATTQHRMMASTKMGHGSSNSHHHRFTFQSTVRQIERRRLAERLSHEAAAMESQRRNELESMRRVEEEFEQKRRRQQQQQRSYHSLPAGSDRSGNNDGHDDGNLDGDYGDERYDADNNPDGVVDTHSPYIHRLVEQKSAGGRMGIM